MMLKIAQSDFYNKLNFTLTLQINRQSASRMNMIYACASFSPALASPRSKPGRWHRLRWHHLLLVFLN